MAGPARPRVAVVGAGITGLAAAHRLLRSMGEGVEVVVFEAGARPGGKIRTTHVGGVPVEAGADSFVVRKPWAVDLCNDLGLGEELVVPGATGAYVWTRGRLTSFPPRSASHPGSGTSCGGEGCRSQLASAGRSTSTVRPAAERETSRWDASSGAVWAPGPRASWSSPSWPAYTQATRID